MSQITKYAMAEALKHLLEQKPLSKVTITDITEACGINRMTFYYHFRDIYDLVDWICLDEGARAIGENRNASTWQEGFQNLCKAVLDNRGFIGNLYHSVKREQVESFLYRVTEGLLTPVVRDAAEGTRITEQEQQYIVDFYKYAFVGVALNWIRTGVQESPEELVGRLSVLLEGQLAHAIHNFEETHHSR